MDLILASTSVYRQRLLERLQLPFTSMAPEVAETAKPGEDPRLLASRLALAKASAVATRIPGALVIGSDQVASIAGVIHGKPGNFEAARAQLAASSGSTVTFYTGVALVGLDAGIQLEACVPFRVHFRELLDSEITDYLEREQPFDCAGSFKCEGLGIALFEAMEGDDPTALEGLPLIALSKMLSEAGMPVLT